MAKNAKRAASNGALKAELDRRLRKLEKKIAAMAIPEASKRHLRQAIRWRSLGVETESDCRAMFPNSRRLLALYKRAVKIFKKILSLSSSKGGKRR